MQSFIRSILRSGWQRVPRPLKEKLFSLSVRDADEMLKFRAGVPTMDGLLLTARENGFHARTIIDIGANVGHWTREVAAIFPGAQHFLFDADPANEPALKQTATTLGDRAEYAISLLGPAERTEVTFYQFGTGSSVLPELTSFSGKTPVKLPMVALDSYMSGRQLASPLLLKLDVQGFELEVLRGGPETLAQAEIVILETALIPYNEGAPLFAEVIGFMADAGFSVFDFGGQVRRQSDQALFQTDVVFVREDSALRAPRKFFLSEL